MVEQGLVVFGVFDGATSLDGACFGDGESGGALASSIAGRTFLRNHHPLLRLGVEANDAIRAGMESCRVDVLRRRGLWSASAAVVRLRDGAVEWFQTGDCQVVFIDGDGGFRMPAAREDHDYPTLRVIRERGRRQGGCPRTGQQRRTCTIYTQLAAHSKGRPVPCDLSVPKAPAMANPSANMGRFPRVA